MTPCHPFVFQRGNIRGRSGREETQDIEIKKHNIYWFFSWQTTICCDRKTHPSFLRTVLSTVRYCQRLWVAGGAQTARRMPKLVIAKYRTLLSDHLSLCWKYKIWIAMTATFNPPGGIKCLSGVFFTIPGNIWKQTLLRGGDHAGSSKALILLRLIEIF